jgi:hypothetical protein
VKVRDKEMRRPRGRWKENIETGTHVKLPNPYIIIVVVIIVILVQNTQISKCREKRKISKR